jgi:3-methyladenine DNA glycosylase/8-oxoguanine DNA glycosylase
MEKLSKNWKPWRTVVARLLWIHEDGIRKERREAEARAKAERAAKLKKKKKKR